MAFSDLNIVVLLGRLTRDPELKYTPSGMAVTNFSIANNKPRKKVEDQFQDQPPNYFNIVAWGRSAETCGQYLKKGSQVAIQGRLQHRTYETNDGQKRSVVEVVANTVQFIGGQPMAGQPQAEQSSTEQSPSEQPSAEQLQAEEPAEITVAEQSGAKSSAQKPEPGTSEEDKPNVDFESPIDDEEIPF